MKRLFYYFIVSLLIAGTSCSDFLDEDPRGLQMVETFYNTESEAYAGLMGLYGRVKVADLVSSNFVNRNDACSDLCTYKPSATADAVAYPRYRLNSDTPPMVNSWNASYATMYSINSFIEALLSNTSPKLSTAIKEQYIKEAKFFRALLYFHLVMRWGDVPLRLSADLETVDIARTPVAELWPVVIQDLTDALTLPDKENTPDGRVSKGTVQTLLAKVHLMKGDFVAAKTVLDQITGYSLMPNIRDVWSPRSKFNDESIWEINYEQGTLPQQGNPALNLIIPVDANYFQGGNGTYPINHYVMQMTEPNSPRTKVCFSDPPTISQASDPAYGANYKGEFNYTNSAGENVKIVFTNATLGPYAHLMKFVDLTEYLVPTRIMAGNNSYNLVIFRYADVVLMKAECECEANNSPLALDYLNQIRTRAGETKYTLTNEAGLKPLSGQDDLREAIRNERAVELAGEGHRLYDLKRWGTAYALAKIKQSRLTVPDDMYDPYLPGDADNVTAERLNWPIPIGEIQGNALMEQNPGYN
jgi:hypothetical protein